jgi:hypothetical protein
MGMRLTIDKLAQYARELLGKHAQLVGAELADAILNASQKTEAEIQEQRKRVRELKSILEGKTDQEMKNLLAVEDYLSAECMEYRRRRWLTISATAVLTTSWLPSDVTSRPGYRSVLQHRAVNPQRRPARRGRR